MAEFRINISNLSEGIHEYVFEAEPSKIGLDERFNSAIELKASLDKSLRQILVQVNMKVEGAFICDRCLDSFTWQMEEKYSMVYIQGNRSTVDIKKDEGVQILSADTNYIDLDEDVRQYVILAIPQKLLCQENCKGLCSSCGKNKNTDVCTCDGQVADSRWDALKKLSHN